MEDQHTPTDSAQRARLTDGHWADRESESRLLAEARHRIRDAIEQAQVNGYLTTFRRIPPAVIIDMAGKEFDMDAPSRCVCGWAFRCDLAQAAGLKAEEGAVATAAQDSLTGCRERFGGMEEEWERIFYGVIDAEAMPLIEEAFHSRVREAACALGLHAPPRMVGWTFKTDDD